VKIADLELLQSVGRPTVAPDGSRAVVDVSHPSFDADDNVGQLWEVPLDGADAGRDSAAAVPRRLTRGAGDSSPQFSPDGTLIAFLRSTGGPAQLVVIDARGGEPIALTDQKLGVGDFAWTPDSAAIVYSARVPEPGRYGSVEGLTATAEPARRITTLKYKANGLGYRDDRPVQLFAVDVPPIDVEPVYDRAPMPSDADGDVPKPAKVPASRQLTEGDTDHTAPRVTPDGAHVLFVAARHDTRDVDLRDDIWMIPLAGSTETSISAPAPVRRTGDAPLAIGDLAVGADGRIWFTAEDLGPAGTDFVAKNGALYLIDGDAVSRVTDPDEHDLADAWITVETTTTVLIAETARGRKPLLRLDDRGAATVLTPGDVEVTGHGVGGGVAVLSLATPTSFGELALLEPEADGGLELLTDFGAGLQARGLVSPVELTVTGRDGYPVHGWVATPAGSGPHPVLLNIHGGPFAQYSVHLFDETQIYVDAGYAVVYCNPRGSAGYGQAHGRAIKDAMGTVDLHDVLDFLDGAIAANSQLDGTRVGILGGSYGGYLTAWTIAHDHRWAGAIVERGFLDPDSFIGTSDIGSFFSAEYTGDTPEHRATQSPQAVVAQVTTPTLVLHSELDLRCPLPQAESYYSSLKRNGVRTELVIFPGENHELSRSGQPRHRQQRFEIILDWWSRMLPVWP
jgi:dipeptidyl aminopeptidase/acylaminoacyl peptidase